MIFIVGLIFSFALSYLIAETWCGGWDKDYSDRAIKLKNTFRLVITPYQKRVFELAIILFPLLLILEVILYWLWLKDIIFKR